jgi:hypothetical protein
MAQSYHSFYARYLELAARARALPHYCDPTFLEKYAMQHRTQLLRARRTILAEYAAFEQDRLFLAFLMQVAPDLVEWQAWRIKVLALAEQLDIGQQPESERHRQRLTPEEFRERMLARERVQALDRMARILEHRRLRAQLRAALHTEFDLDEEDLYQIEREFTDALSTEPDEGPYKQL